MPHSPHREIQEIELRKVGDQKAYIVIKKNIWKSKCCLTKATVLVNAQVFQLFFMLITPQWKADISQVGASSYLLTR